MNPTLPMLEHSMGEMLQERTNANKKVHGKSMYKVIIKILHSSKKPIPPTKGKQEVRVLIHRKLQREMGFL